MKKPSPADTAEHSWRRRKAERPGEILDAALKVFAEKGFAAARMADIAARAGVTKGTIYLYFESKEDVFKTLARETVGTVLTDFDLRVKSFSGPARDLLILMLRSVSEFLSDRDRAALPKIIIAESGNFPDLAKFWVDEVVNRALGLIQYALQRGVETGEFRSLPPNYAVRVCIAPIILGVIWRTTFASVIPASLDSEAFFTTQIDILLHGICTEGPPT